MILLRHTINKQRGFSLVELMIALTLGLLLTAAIGALFYSNKKNFTQNRLIAEMQDNARFALETIARDVSMAGFLGGMTDVRQLEITLASPSNDCTPGADGAAGWAFDTAAIEFLNNTGDSAAKSVYGCMGTNSVLSGTDMVSIRRVSGQSAGTNDGITDDVNLAANTLYLITNRTEGALFNSGSDPAPALPTEGPASSPPYSVWEYVSRLYFVRDFAEQAGDDVPTLCRAVLTHGASPAIEIEVLAEGVEDFQMAFGIDNDNDSIADTYAFDPTDAQLANAVTARIQLLVRSVDPDYSYSSGKTYDLLSKAPRTIPANDDNDADHYYRRIIQTTVPLRNPAIIQGITP